MCYMSRQLHSWCSENHGFLLPKLLSIGIRFHIILFSSSSSYIIQNFPQPSKCSSVYVPPHSLRVYRITFSQWLVFQCLVSCCVSLHSVCVITIYFNSLQFHWKYFKRSQNPYFACHRVSHEHVSGVCGHEFLLLFVLTVYMTQADALAPVMYGVHGYAFRELVSSGETDSYCTIVRRLLSLFVPIVLWIRLECLWTPCSRRLFWCILPACVVNLRPLKVFEIHFMTNSELI
jgi:hypothetical protein